MTLQNLLAQTPWLLIAEAFVRLYPEQVSSLNAHHNVYQSLMKMKPGFPSGEIIFTRVDEDEEDPYVAVAGRNPAANAGELKIFALDFVPWSECPAMSIAPEALM